MKGNPRCETCSGRGGSIRRGVWYRCHCTRPNHAAADVLQQANTRADQPRLSMADMLARGSSSNRRASGR